MTCEERVAFGVGWDAACTGETPKSGCPYLAGTSLAAHYAQGFSESCEGFSDCPAEVGDWKDLVT